MPCKRILLVDDMKLFLQLGKSMMDRKNLCVEIAQSGIEAIDKAFRSPPDIIFLDFFMPDLNGDEVCWMLKNDPRTESVPVVMFSFDGNPEVLSPCFAAGCDDFITKPIRVEILQSVMERHMKERARKFERAKVDIPCELLHEEEKRQARILSISPFGGFVQMNPLPYPETLYTLAFELPETNHRLQVDALPRWTRKVSKDSPVGSGFEFQNIKDDEFKRIGRFVTEKFR